MKASELIHLYKQGRRNFCTENLRGEIFDGQELSDINLSHADIRGASFVNANLTGANFSYVRAGTTFTVSFIRTIFQLTIACSAMSLSIYYCINYASMLARSLGGELDPDTGGLGFGMLLYFCLYPSLPFLFFSATWIRKNCTSILSSYFITVFVVNIIVSPLRNKTSLIAGFILQFMMLSPLIILVSTTVYYIVESLPYQGTWIWQATTFNGAMLQKADFFQATLGNTDFRFSLLKNTCFYQAKYLNIKLFKNTRLESRKLLIKSIKTKVNRKRSR